MSPAEREKADDAFAAGAPVARERGISLAEGHPPGGFWPDSSGWRRAWFVVLVAAIGLTGMMATLAVGMWRNDMRIDANPVRTTATVLTVTALSTGIEFVDNKGVAQRPPSGVLYPGGLTVGQQFLVEYAADDPTRVRVAGRTAINGLIMPAAVVVLIWAVAAPVLWWLSRRDRKLPPELARALAAAHRDQPPEPGLGNQVPSSTG